MSLLKKTIKKYTFLILTLLLICRSATSFSQTFDPFDGKAAAFHVQFSRYFNSTDNEKVLRILVLDSLHAYQLDTAWNLTNLHNHLDGYENLLVSLERHNQYFRLRCYVDNKDTSAKRASTQIDEAIGSLQGMVGRLLIKPVFTNLNAAQINRYNLLPYKYLLVQASREAAHNLSDHDEALISTFSDAAIDQLTDRYDNLMDNIKAEPVQLGNQKYNPVTDLSVILKSPDSALRQKGMAAYYKAYNNHAELLGATLIDITRQKIALAKLRGFSSAPERAYQRRLQLSEVNVKQMLSAMTLHADVLKAYQRVQQQQIGLLSGLKQVHSWDTSLPLGFTVKPMTYADVKPLVLNALLPLGEVYERYFARLLDPANGELDIAAGPDRVTEFTSVGFPRVAESLYMKNYSGSLRDISRLAHEGGHAVHEQLMSDNLAVPSYHSGPSFLYESYAMFNELLLMDALEKQEKTIQGKAYYTKMFLDKLSLEVFTSAEEGTFEQEIYDGVAKGNINNSEDVDSLYAGIMNKYDIYFAGEPQRRSEWINKRLVFDDPIYNVNYLYAILVSCKLYAMVHEDPKGFPAKYTALLKNGFNAPAEDLLQKFMGFGLNEDALLKGTLQMMNDKTTELKMFYDKLNKLKAK